MVTAICLITAVLANNFIDKRGSFQYEASAKIIVGNINEVLNYKNVQDCASIYQKYVSIYSEIANSKRVASKVIKNIKDKKITAVELSKNISISSMPDSQMILISYKNNDPQKAISIMKTYLNVFMKESQKIFPLKNVQVIDNVQIINELEKSNKIKYLSIPIALIIAFLISGFITFILEYLSNTVKKKFFIEREIGIPVLGYIPIKTKVENDIYEAYRIIRTSIELQHSDKKLSTLLVTNPKEEDNSDTSIKLAEAFSSQGFKTLLINIDMNSKVIADKFKIKENFGLFNYICEKGNLSKYIHKTDNKNLDIMLTGCKEGNLSDKINKNEEIDNILNSQREYEYIIINSSSILDHSDAQLFSKFSDGVLIAVTYDKTSEKDCYYTKQLTDRLDINVLGAVFRE